jgi:F-type H+-transporting ATPase subunit delta
MANSRIAARYAKSLVDLALETQSLDAVYQDFLGLQKALESREFLNFIKSPIIAPGKKSEIFSTLFQEKLQKISFSFLLLVIKKGREAAMPDIVTEFVSQYRKRNNIVPVRLISAVPMPADTVEKVRNTLLETKTLSGELLMTNVVDPKIIGGFQIEFDDKLIDASISHRLDLLRRELHINLYESKIRSL